MFDQAWNIRREPAQQQIAEHEREACARRNRLERAAHERERQPVAGGVLRRVRTGLGIDLEPKRLRRPQAQRSQPQDPAAGSDVEHAIALDQRLQCQSQGQPRTGVLAGAERLLWIDQDLGRSSRRAPGRPDPERTHAPRLESRSPGPLPVGRGHTLGLVHADPQPELAERGDLARGSVLGPKIRQQLRGPLLDAEGPE
jgi:hypothetical protein